MFYTINFRVYSHNEANAVLLFKEKILPKIMNTTEGKIKNFSLLKEKIDEPHHYISYELRLDYLKFDRDLLNSIVKKAFESVSPKEHRGNDVEIVGHERVFEKAEI